MKRINQKRRAWANVPVSFLIVMCVLLIALGWLGWLLLDQDRSLQHERTRNRVDSAANEISEALKRRTDELLSSLETLALNMSGAEPGEIEELLRSQSGPGVTIYFAQDHMWTSPANSLRYSPAETTPAGIPDALARADQLEYQQESPRQAIRQLQLLTETSNPSIQAGAHMRLGRIYNRQGDLELALEEYAHLAGFNDEYLERVPAPWLARYARCKIFAAMDEEQAFDAELALLSDLITRGAGHVTKSTYQFYAESVNNWVQASPARSTQAPVATFDALSDAAADLHFLWKERIQGRGSDFGTTVAGQGQNSLVEMWISLESALLGKVLTLSDLHENGLKQTTQDAQAAGIGWSINDTQGRQLFGALDGPLGEASSQTLTIGDTPLVVSAFATSSLLPLPEDIRRYRLLLAGLLMVLIVILASTYFMTRALRREAETTELKEKFVAAVSHEFRTPLTSIRQLIELLASGRIHDQEKIHDYYRILDRESARLQRMVEDLLDFGRMEANAAVYRPEKINIGELLADTSAAFSEEHRLPDTALTLQPGEEQFVHMDRESLVRVIWNLLDNAVKYSKEKPQITISTKSERGKVEISIRDCGIGISQEEQGKVFNKFVRGEAARISNARGTGLGLAMVSESLLEQGGSIRLKSSVGKGSVFTIVLDAQGPA